MQTELDRWFVHEILVHEDALMRFLHRHWPHRDELHDLRQELYARLYEAAAKAVPAQPKAFLFASARHLMTDRLRRGKVVSIEPMGDFEPSHVLIDEVSPERWCGGRQALRRLSEAFEPIAGPLPRSGVAAAGRGVVAKGRGIAPGNQREDRGKAHR
ncbi:RNA polymerase sigma factor [Thermomonas brevis]